MALNTPAQNRATATADEASRAARMGGDAPHLHRRAEKAHAAASEVHRAHGNYAMAQVHDQHAQEHLDTFNHLMRNADGRAHGENNVAPVIVHPIGGGTAGGPSADEHARVTAGRAAAAAFVAAREARAPVSYRPTISKGDGTAYGKSLHAESLARQAGVFGTAQHHADAARAHVAAAAAHRALGNTHTATEHERHAEQHAAQSGKSPARPKGQMAALRTAPEKHPAHALHHGKKGGAYYLTPSGQKVYVGKGRK